MFLKENFLYLVTCGDYVKIKLSIFALQVFTIINIAKAYVKLCNNINNSFINNKL
jgi:hypothetical protein